MKQINIVPLTVFLFATTAFALDPVTRPLRTKVEKLPPAESIPVPAERVKAMKALKAEA